MKGVLTILVFIQINCLMSEQNGTSIDEYLGRPYEFNVFENFEECSRLYQSEKTFLSKLKELQLKLQHSHKDLIRVWLQLIVLGLIEIFSIKWNSIHYPI